MFDIELRKIKDIMVEQPARLIGKSIHPTVITLLGFVIGLFAVLFILFELPIIALVLWLLNRFFDGLDGAVARNSERKSDVGGYIDLIADFILYTIIPIAIAWTIGETTAFAAVAVLLGVFYVNAAVWMAASSLFEKRRAENIAVKDTSISMPRGLIEGFETLLFFSAMIALPSHFVLLAIVMAGLTGLGLVIRFVQTLVALK